MFLTSILRMVLTELITIFTREKNNTLSKEARHIILYKKQLCKNCEDDIDLSTKNNLRIAPTSKSNDFLVRIFYMDFVMLDFSLNIPYC